MNAAFISWLDKHPGSYLWLAGGLIALTFALAVVPFVRHRPAPAPGHDWAWGWLLAVVLLAGRWPSFLFTWELNPDESQLLAGAHALTFDPVFWRSVNGGTAGPLDFFALWPAGWICGWDTFFTARITALALLAAALVLAHQCLSLLAGRQVARVACLGAVTFEALTCAPDFLHYSTELVAILLLAVAAYAAVRRWAAEGGPGWSGLGGLMLGAVPLAKLQAVPLAGLFGLAWLTGEFLRKDADARRHRIYLVTGAVLPALLFAGQLTASGEWNSFYASYVLSNFVYVEAAKAGREHALLGMWNYSVADDALLHFWLPASVVWMALAVRWRTIGDRRLRIALGLAAAATGLACFCVVTPGRPYLHYWQLLVVPSVLFLGLLLAALLSSAPAKWQRTERWLMAACAAAVVGAMLLHRARVPNGFLPSISYLAQNPHTPLALRVMAQARPGETLAVWGRADYLYVETGLCQALRDSHIVGVIDSGPLQDYLRRRYLADLRFTKPVLFVDCVGPASIGYRDPQQAHDINFPELAAVIREGYVLVDSGRLARIYRRKDTLAH